MRDDLHRTPALLRSWRGAVRHAARPADADRVAYDMSRAAKEQMNAGLRPELVEGLRTALGGNHGQLFPESRLDALRSIERLANHQVERGLVEAARALCLRSPETTDIMDAAQRTLFKQLIDNGIEHCVASVRSEHGTQQSAPLRMSMLKYRAECSLELGSQGRPKKLNTIDFLNLAVLSP